MLLSTLTFCNNCTDFAFYSNLAILAKEAAVRLAPPTKAPSDGTIYHQQEKKYKKLIYIFTNKGCCRNRLMLRLTCNV